MTDPPQRPPRGPAGCRRVIGLGASAGGLEPLEQFLAQMPAASGMACIVVQHMDPTHKAMLSQLLQRATILPVQEVAESTRIEPDHVYVIPPNADMTVAAGVLHLAEPSRPRGLRLPIDTLFCSLARELCDQAVGVVLSGMGSDGTLGLEAIHAQGGLTLAQLPESAQFDSMPRSAIAAGCVDVVALPAAMPARIVDAAGQDAAEPQAAGPDPGALARILALLHEHTRHDLAQYKPNSLVRRIGRRMAVHGLPTMEAYAAFLLENPHELDLLFKEVLIGVTAFFRDPEVWQDFGNTVLPALLASRAAELGPLRAWVAGCSTGEEAYTLAMLFIEVAERSAGNGALGLQVFATDLNADAIAVARAGQYPATIQRDLTPERLKRFFIEHAGGYRIDKRVREMVRFAQHDVILDPPFTRLDILSCRNLMIYFGAALQKRLLPLFHYSLRPGGVLLLGTSETVGRSQGMFRPAHPKSRAYWRCEHDSAVGSVPFPARHGPSPRHPSKESHLPHLDTPQANLQSLADQVLLQAFSPPAVLVNAAGDILYINGRTGRYLEPAAGKANWNIHAMAKPGIRAQLAVALRGALQDKSTVELRGLRLDDGAPASVDVVVRAVMHPKALEGMALIVFRDVAAAPGRRTRQSARSAGAGDAALAEELMRAREEISALRQEMRASQEALQAANEDLQSTNEELQSANEELTTSKEEAQSMNEELQTINGELQSRLDDLALAQSDMQNLLNSTDIATLFLDNDLNVRRFTEQITRVVHLREADIGRPLSDLATTLVYPELQADVKETLRTLAFVEKEIATTDGRWFSVRIMPYRTLTNVIQGAVITFIDITDAKNLESRLRKA
jgi:two-component system CheB/CheR fusion protein